MLKIKNSFFLFLKSSRLEDQRSSLLPKQTNTTQRALSTTNNNNSEKSISHIKFAKQQAITVPPNDDDLFTLIQRLQSRRLDEQRSEIPKSFNNRQQQTNSAKIFNK